MPLFSEADTQAGLQTADEDIHRRVNLHLMNHPPLSNK